MKLVHLFCIAVSSRKKSYCLGTVIIKSRTDFRNFKDSFEAIKHVNCLQSFGLGPAVNPVDIVTLFFGRPFVKWLALCCRPLSVSPVCLCVCDVGV